MLKGIESLLFEDPSQESQRDSSIVEISDGVNPVLPGQLSNSNTWTGISYPGFAESSPMIPR